MSNLNHNPALFYDENKQCYAVSYNGEVEYFNKEWDSKEDNRKNAVACFNLLNKKNENKI